MKSKLSVLISAVSALAAALAASPVLPAANLNFVAHLSGDEEVPPVDTKAQGQALFHLPKDADEISYKLIVANIENVTQAHIHLAPAGANGPVVAWLYPDSPPSELIPGRSDGVLATGTISAADLVGPLEGATLEDLLEAMIDGDTYVNVHTQQFPPGEVRGQIKIGKPPAQVAVKRSFVAPLSGDEEVPPVATRARGNTVFKLSSDGTAIEYRLMVANLHNVTQAHIHRAPAGANGPVVAWLYPDSPPSQLIPGRSSGVLATGTITAADLVGPLEGATLGDLLDEMTAGNTYVNVHTQQFPPGEIRGQIR